MTSNNVEKRERLTYPILPETTFREAREMVSRLELCGWEARIEFDDRSGLLVVRFPSSDLGTVYMVMTAIGSKITPAYVAVPLVEDLPIYEEVA